MPINDTQARQKPTSDGGSDKCYLGHDYVATTTTETTETTTESNSKGKIRGI